MDNLHINDFALAEKDFTEAYGQALIQWGIVEQRLCFWFEVITGMSESMARAIFYSVGSFSARSRLLRAAIETTENKKVVEFLRAASKKAGHYDSYRNHIVHRETKFDASSKSPTYKQMVLVEGKLPQRDMLSTAITVEDLHTARDRFRDLARLIGDVLYREDNDDAASIERCRAQVLALPSLTPPDGSIPNYEDIEPRNPASPG